MDPEESFVAVKNTTESCIPSVGSDDEDSFVVLESSSYNENVASSTKEEVLPPIRTNKVHEMQSLTKLRFSQISSDSMPDLPAAVDALDAVASSIATITINPDSSFEEIQKQVEELIKENEKLKNIIAQNNLSMKTQYSRFLAYRDEVTNVMKSYKEKFNEAKVCIDKYKEDNTKLAGDVEVYINIKKLHEEEILNLKQKLIEAQNIRQVNLKTDSNVVGLDSNIERKISDLQTALTEANHKITEVTAENEKLKQDSVNRSQFVDELNSKKREVEKQGHIIKDLQTNMAQANLKIDESIVEKRKLEEELQIKQREIEKLTKQLVSTPKLQEELQNKLEELNILNMEVTNWRNVGTKLQTENEELQARLSSISKEKEQLVQSTTAAATFEQLAKIKDSEIADLKEEQQRLTRVERERTEEVNDLKTKFQSYQEKYTPRLLEDFKQSRTQLSIAQRTITALEEERELKIQEIEDLRKLLQNSHTNEDELCALREQLKVFESDYKAETESKTSMKREKDQFAEDIQNLQKRNRQLQNEIETLRARLEPKSDGYTCPKCSFGFSTYQSLENHVHRCLDLEEEFP